MYDQVRKDEQALSLIKLVIGRKTSAMQLSKALDNSVELFFGVRSISPKIAFSFVTFLLAKQKCYISCGDVSLITTYIHLKNKAIAVKTVSFTELQFMQKFGSWLVLSF